MKKTTKRKGAKRADNKSISYRLTEKELGPVLERLAKENDGSRPEIKLAAYAKHALNLHGPLSDTVARLVAVRREFEHSGAEDFDRGWILSQLDAVLQGASS